MRRGWLVGLWALWLLLGGTIATAVAADTTCAQLIARGVAEFDQVQYGKARDLFRYILEQELPCTDAEKVTVHLYLAKIELVYKDREAAIEHMVAALTLDPYLTVDPVKTSPKIHAVLNEARERVKAAQATAPESISDEQPSRVAAWSTFGVGLALTAAAGGTFAFAVVENQKQQDAVDDEDFAARDRHWERANNYATAAAVLGATAAATLGVSTYLFLRDPDPAPADTAWRWAPTFDGNRYGLAICGRF